MVERKYGREVLERVELEGFFVYFMNTENRVPVVIQASIIHDKRTKNRSIGPELTTAKTGPIHLSSFVEIAFVD